MNDKKFILINGNGSEWYEQAIFIVNKNNENMPKNIVFEAEKIINEHLKKKYPKNNISIDEYPNDISSAYNNTATIKTLEKRQPKKTSKKVNMYLNLSIFCTISIIICLLYLILY